ncbi:MAG: hypothetical protein B7Z66_00555 [Chromatiales bacterium 21-64-14]|nr:MAG: hypothetical protein B7Z66_00555 [Chromatiales bacterium 21-64-14]HQU15520.1 ferritin-like domain-containing protein [Gammaproteobacteria bacterium]
MGDLFEAAWGCLRADRVEEKIALGRAAAHGWRIGHLNVQSAAAPEPLDAPGRPPRPPLVVPRELAPRHLSSPEGRAALLHALAHIEFNAINLAWDAVYRFRGLPVAYYADWVRVAEEEATHFRLLQRRLRELGHAYGDFPGHDGLWDMARQTAHDPLVRMALVPRVLEARGLDVTPGILARLEAVGDRASAAILRVIQRDEIGHVAVGTRWFRYLCSQRGLDTEVVYGELLLRFAAGRIRGPFQRGARHRAGFTDGEMDLLERLWATRAERR